MIFDCLSRPDLEAFIKTSITKSGRIGDPDIAEVSVIVEAPYGDETKTRTAFRRTSMLVFWQIVASECSASCCNTSSCVVEDRWVEPLFQPKLLGMDVSRYCASRPCSSRTVSHLRLDTQWTARDTRSSWTGIDRATVQREESMLRHADTGHVRISAL